MATTVSAVTAAPEGATPAHKPWRTGLGRERILQVSFLVPAAFNSVVTWLDMQRAGQDL